MANLCLVARAASDPAAFMVEVFGDEPWARELGVAVQRRRLSEAELALFASRSEGVRRDPVDVLRSLTGPVRRFRYATDGGVVTAPHPCPEEAALRLLGIPEGMNQPASEHAMRDLGWILIEDGDHAPLMIHCNAVAVSDGACESLMAWLDREMPSGGATLRVFITDWVDFHCSTRYQILSELNRVREIRHHITQADRAIDRSGDSARNVTVSERLGLSEAPASGAAFLSIWREAGGIVDSELIHRVIQASLFELGGVFGVKDHQFRVEFVGAKLRLPQGMTRDQIMGHDLLEIQPSRGFGTMVASHFALAAHERAPVVHFVRVAGRRPYRRVSFPIFDRWGRKVVAIIGFSDARNTERDS
ncbi:hypothetical protein F1188_09135 [Roseospira marina]|uniref:PAS domain-containing protein n=1 Tax=Roseospira marina TaxID=140057 RepID=A0A5M6IC48_9PROT|nr:hypothetical protein [Roseospira marina]KAA5605773.1 hypothetical protein F1188_09135 [Roseospira marina]MBB4313582.1 hypothetical protein [Roseospira marina]MBB5086744.1 hypothetical protein [Roseospira marina]